MIKYLVLGCTSYKGGEIKEPRIYNTLEDALINLNDFILEECTSIDEIITCIKDALAETYAGREEECYKIYTIDNNFNLKEVLSYKEELESEKFKDLCKKILDE